MLQKIEATVNYIQSKCQDKPEVALVLGSGLGGFADKIDTSVSIPFSEIPHFPVSTVEGHSGEIIFGTFNGKKVVALKGRFHYYEGYDMSAVTYYVRVLKKLGIKTLFVSNAAGGVNPSFEVGDVMMITDHISFFGVNPLIGKNMEEFGPRFPDMSNAYNDVYCQTAREVAQKNNIRLQEGVYVGLTGPSFETPTEYRMLHMLGADAVGMSTVPEVIVANHCGIKCFGMSVITNNGLAIPEEGNQHSEVLDVAAVAEPKMTAIISGLLETL